MAVHDPEPTTEVTHDRRMLLGVLGFLVGTVVMLVASFEIDSSSSTGMGWVGFPTVWASALLVAAGMLFMSSSKARPFALGVAAALLVSLVWTAIAAWNYFLMMMDDT